MDINCDMGEIPGQVFGGLQESLMPHLTSVNIACGAHAGDERTMRATIGQAMRHNVAIGAHPGYAGRARFGREPLRLSRTEIADSVCGQLQTFARIAAACRATITHVKAHGALYNQAARDPEIAGALAEGLARWNRGVAVVTLAASPTLSILRDAGFRIAEEAFADRRYEPGASLRSREFEDALILDPAEAAAQAVRIAQRGAAIAVNGAEISVRAQTICVHGDTPGAPQIAAAVHAALRAAGIALHPL